MEQNQKDKNGNCPLCKVSEETLEALKNNKSKKPAPVEASAGQEIKNKKSFWKIW